MEAAYIIENININCKWQKSENKIENYAYPENNIELKLYLKSLYFSPNITH